MFIEHGNVILDEVVLCQVGDWKRTRVQQEMLDDGLNIWYRVVVVDVPEKGVLEEVTDPETVIQEVGGVANTLGGINNGNNNSNNNAINSNNNANDIKDDDSPNRNGPGSSSSGSSSSSSASGSRPNHSRSPRGSSGNNSGRHIPSASPGGSPTHSNKRTGACNNARTGQRSSAVLHLNTGSKDNPFGGSALFGDRAG
jgi:hypothetical protein